MRGFRVFLACLVLGVATTAAVGSLGEALKAGLARDARMILGGDVELVQFSRPLNQAVTDYLETNTTALSHVVTMRSMAHLEDGSSRSLVELKAVDGAYPLVDRVRLEGGMALDDAVAGGGAVAEKGLLDRLGLGIGDKLRVGSATLTVRAVLAREPDRLTAGISLGPRLMMDHASLEAAGLMQPGALVRHRYRALIPDEQAGRRLDGRAGGGLPRRRLEAARRTRLESLAQAPARPGRPVPDARRARGPPGRRESASPAPSPAICTASCTRSRRLSAWARRAPQCNAPSCCRSVRSDSRPSRRGSSSAQPRRPSSQRSWATPCRCRSRA